MCTIMHSSGPLDHEGMLYLTHRGQSSSADPIDQMETNMDGTSCRKGVVRSNKDSKMRNRGPKPNDQEQKEWAPFIYFVHAVAGSIVAMMHKMGMIRLRLNYGVKSILEHLCNHVGETLACLIVADDERNSSRYPQPLSLTLLCGQG